MGKTVFATNLGETAAPPGPEPTGRYATYCISVKVTVPIVHVVA